MKIIFMGTPAFAVPALSALASAGHDIRGVVTQPDKAKDRGNKVKATPVKEKALELEIEVWQPDTLKGNIEIEKKIAEQNPDIIVVAAYGQLLPVKILNIPAYGCINIHASLLPRWRGAAPIQRAIMEGDEITGITIMRMAEGLDNGDMIMSKSTEIGRKTAAELHDELSDIGAELIVAAIAEIEKGRATEMKQDESLAIYAPMIFKTDGRLDFNNCPERLERLVRALDPWPGAYADYRGERIKIWEAVASGEKNDFEDGSITGVSDNGIEISAGGRTLVVTEIQTPGKKRVKIKEFLKGNKIEKFEILR